MRSLRPAFSIWPLLVVLVTVLLLLSLASGVWASPSQHGLRQTVPTRTPTEAPTNTTEPPTDTPQPPTPTPEPPTLTPQPPTLTPEPLTPTPKQKKEEKPQPTEVPTQAAEATATPTTLGPAEAAGATETAAAISSAGYPESGTDRGGLLLGAGLFVALGMPLGWVILRSVLRRRRSPSHR